MKPTPTPRPCYFFGCRTATDGTWIEPEEWAYPAGGFTRRAYVTLYANPHNPITLPYGERRIVQASIADTYWTIPARLRVGGRMIRGFVDHDEVTGYRFTPEADPTACMICQPDDGCRRMS